MLTGGSQSHRLSLLHCLAVAQPLSDDRVELSEDAGHLPPRCLFPTVRDLGRALAAEGKPWLDLTRDHRQSGDILPAPLTGPCETLVATGVSHVTHTHIFLPVSDHQGHCVLLNPNDLSYLYLRKS